MNAQAVYLEPGRFVSRLGDGHRARITARALAKPELGGARLVASRRGAVVWAADCGGDRAADRLAGAGDLDIEVLVAGASGETAEGEGEKERGEKGSHDC